MLRPRDGHDLRVIDLRMSSSPEPISLRWIDDVLGNSVGIAKFDRQAGPACRSKAKSPSTTIPSHGIEPAAGRRRLPLPLFIAVNPDEIRTCGARSAANMTTLRGKIEAWAREFVNTRGPTKTHDLLIDITHAIKLQFTYRRRLDPGVQSPLETLQLCRGTCRDFALFMIEAVRSLGFAARFVSGYLHVPAQSGRTGAVDPRLDAGLFAGRGLDGIRSDQWHRRQSRSDPRRRRARSAPGVPLWGTFKGFLSIRSG